MPEEFGGPRWYQRAKKPFQWLWKAFIWLRTRRAASAVTRAIANNQVAVAALAASVAAGSIGALATYSAHEAQSDANRALQKAADLEVSMAIISADVRAQDAKLGSLETAVKKYKNASDAQIRAMGKDAQTLAQNIAMLADSVASLPVAPSTAPLAAQVAALAEDTRDAAKAAEAAAAKAAEDRPDLEARAAALAAQTDARLAATKADEAAKVAQQANLDALAAGAAANAARAEGQRALEAALAAGKSAEEAAAIGAQAQRDALEALNKPGYQPFPRYIRWADDVDPVTDPPFNRNFTIDLPDGNFRLTLNVGVQTQPTQAWRGRISGGGVTAPLTSGVGNGELVSVIDIASVGGTLVFNVNMDAHVSGPGNITWLAPTITVEKL